MQNNSNRRGLAVGAAIALIGTFFGAAPASYAVTDGQFIEIRPMSNSGLTNFGGLLTEDFAIYAELKSGGTNANADFDAASVKWQIERVSGALDVIAATSTVSGIAKGQTAVGLNGDFVSSAAAGGVTRNSTSNQILALGLLGVSSSNLAIVHADSTSAVLSAKFLGSETDGTGWAPLFLRASSTSGITSSSPNLTVKVTVWIDNITGGAATDRLDSGEWFTTQTITLNATGRLAPSLSVGSPAYGDSVVTASAALASINWSNLNGKAFMQVSASDRVFTGAGVASASPEITGNQATERAGVFSHSFTVTTPLTGSTVVSGEMRYLASGNVTDSAGIRIGNSISATVAALSVNELSVTASATANLVSVAANQLTVRPNQTHTIRVLASSGSGAASVASTVTVTFSGTALSEGTVMFSVNGGAFTSSYAGRYSVTTGTDGIGTFTIATTGFIGGNQISISAFVGGVRASEVNLLTADPVFTATADSTHYVTTPGTAVNLGFSVRDQWNQLSTRTDHFLRVTRGGTGFNYATTISHEPITAGRATVAFTPAPATATGSATVTVQSHRLLEGAYVALGTATTQVTVTVTSSAMAFAAGLAASRAATVSYFPSTVSWVTVEGNASAAGAGITVTGTDLVFRLSAAVPATTSGTFAMNAGAAGAYSFQVAALKPGTKTMTLTTGTATTTSLVVVGQGGSDQGRSITWDTTTIEAGKTRVVTGTLLDLNGNAIDTTAVGRTAGDSGTASIVVTYTGTAGIVVGTMPTETDADGKFRVSVLTSAADSGTITITAVYMPQGASTVASRQVTSVQAITVTPAAAPEVNAVIGSFNGRWAVRVENARGSVVSVKAGNRWVKFSALNNNYLFSRKSVVGRTIAVSVWVDGELQNSQTITIK